MAYIRHDINNNPVSPQPGVSTVSDLGGVSGWSTVTYQNYNSDFIARTYNGLSVREVNSFTARNIDNTARTPAVNVRHDETNLPTPVLDLRFTLNKSLTDHISGNNLITFSRASSGTFVDSGGLIKTTPVNKLLHSEDFSQNAWSKLNVSSITTGQLAPDNTNTAAKIAFTNANNWFIYQDAGSVVGQPYIGHVYLKGSANATLGLRKPGMQSTDVGSSGTLSISVTTEWQKFESITSSAENTDGRLLIDGRSSNGASVPADFELFIWHPQVEDGTTANSYVKTGSTISGAPRFDHDPATGESLGLLIEESRTNLVANSVGGQIQSRSGFSPPTSVDGPGGANTAFQYLSTGGTNVTSRIQFKSVVAANATQYTATIYIKGVNYNEVSFGFSATGFASNSRRSFFLDTLTTGSTGGAAELSIEDAGNGWRRIRTTSTATTSASGITVFLDLGNPSTENHTSDQGFQIYGLQIEAGTFPTSYIPTSGSAVTRAPDITDITGTNFSSFYNQIEGTFFTHTGVRGVDNDTVDSSRVILFAGPDLQNAHWLEYRNRSTQITTRSKSDTNNYYNPVDSLTPVNYLNDKVSISYSATGGAGAIGGVVKTNSSLEFTPTPVSLNIGQRTTGGVTVRFLNGHIKRLAYMPHRLPDTILQSMTS